VGTLFATAAAIAPLLASGAMSLAIARRYGPSATGVMSLVMNLFDIVLMIFTVGLSSGITYFVSRGEWALARASRDMRRSAVGLGTAGAVAGLAFYGLTRDTVFRGVAPAYAIVSLASLPFALQWAFAAAAALGRDRYEAFAMLEISNALVILVGGVGLALAFGIAGAVIAFASANVLAATVGIVWMRREIAREHASNATPVASGSLLRRAAKFGLQTWSANFLQLLNYRLDIFILSAVAARSTVGVYSIAVSVTALGWILPNAFQTVLFPRVASMDAAARAGRIDAEASDAVAAQAVRHSVLIVVPIGVLSGVLILLVPLIYGPSFEGSVGLGFILIPGVAIAVIAKVASAVSSGRGFPRYALYTGAISVPATLAWYLILIPSFRATGAALASTLSYVLTTVVTVFYFRRATGISFRRAMIPRQSDLADYFDAFRSARARLRRA
jgi:O-antigen/teichoic acid export membrane protein